MFHTIRASRPGSLVSVAPCKSFGMRVQVEFRGKAKAKWALEAIKAEARAVALIDHEGRMVAKSAGWPA